MWTSILGSPGWTGLAIMILPAYGQWKSINLNKKNVVNLLQTMSLVIYMENYDDLKTKPISGSILVQ